MIRTQICIPQRQHKALKNESKRMGISMAEFLRRIIDDYFEKGKANVKKM